MLSKLKGGLACFGEGSDKNKKKSNDTEEDKPAHDNADVENDPSDSEAENSENDNADFENSTTNDRLRIWSRDLKQHYLGEYSYAIIEGNAVSQVEVGKHGTFVGVYDGHGGPDCADFLSHHFFDQLMDCVKQSNTVSEEVLRHAFSATENKFKEFVESTRRHKPAITAIGSSCVVGVIWRGMIYVANVGDSEALLASLTETHNLSTQQLTQNHNVNSYYREDYQKAQPYEDDLLVRKRGVWLIKGLIQVSRSIGDFYLKDRDYGGPIERRAVLSATPHFLKQFVDYGKFLIFASRGFWEHLSHDEAVKIVRNNPRVAIAKRLIHKALRRAARKHKMKFAELKSKSAGERRQIHDDMNVVVIFLDQNTFNQEEEIPAGLSTVGFFDSSSSRIKLLSNLPREGCEHVPGPSKSSQPA